jgi:hypothetical protein
MARVTKKSLLKGLSGKIGNLVIRQVGEETVVSAAERGPRAPRSPRQQAQLGRMYQAQLYGSAQHRDAEAKALYATRIDSDRTSARSVAIADYMHSPEIQAVDRRGYQGRLGDQLQVEATDDFAVTAVAIRIEGPAGEVLIQGPARLQASGNWVFTAGLGHALPPGSMLYVEAFDRPGNVTTESYAW